MGWGLEEVSSSLKLLKIKLNKISAKVYRSGILKTSHNLSKVVANDSL